MNHEKEIERIHYSVKLTNKGNKTLLSFSFFDIRCLIKNTSLHETYIRGFITVFISLFLRVKKLPYTLIYVSYINASNKMFILSFSISFVCLIVILSHSLRHLSLGLSTSSLTLREKTQPFVSGRCPFLRALHLGKLSWLFLASFLFWTQHQHTHPAVKSSTLRLRKTLLFQGVAHWQTNFTLYCVISLYDSATANSPSSKELNPSSQEDANFLDVAPWHTVFTSSCIIRLWDSATAH